MSPHGILLGAAASISSDRIALEDVDLGYCRRETTLEKEPEKLIVQA
jgi:hypothetical protein